MQEKCQNYLHYSAFICTFDCEKIHYVMEKTVKVKCLNNGEELDVPIGSQLEDVFAQSGLQMKYGPTSARVNNKVEGMHYRVYRPKTVEFLDITSASGNRAYIRTLFFIFCKAVSDLGFDPANVSIDIPVSNGYYVNMQLPRPITLEDVGNIRQRMQQIIDAAIPIHRHEADTEEVISMFQQMGELSKVKLFRSTGRMNTIY